MPVTTVKLVVRCPLAVKILRLTLGLVQETGVGTPAIETVGCGEALLHSMISPTPRWGRPYAITSTVRPLLSSVLGLTLTTVAEAWATSAGLLGVPAEGLADVPAVAWLGAPDEATAGAANVSGRTFCLPALVPHRNRR